MRWARRVTIGAESFGPETTEGELVAATRTHYTLRRTDDARGHAACALPAHRLRAAAGRGLIAEPGQQRMHSADMPRRRLLRMAAALPWAPLTVLAGAEEQPARLTRTRVRPGDPDWPSAAEWQRLRRQAGGRLSVIDSPLMACRATPAAAECARLFKAVKNPYFISDHPALTQTLGWVDAWTSMPSIFVVAARETGDVVAAIDFAREHRLRLVVRSGGHSYQGTSNAPDSLLVWMRGMNAIEMHDAFVAAGCEGSAAPQRAVSVGGGALWAQVYDAVSTQAGGYVQGGGCLSVGVAGLVQSGGFGSFSKRYGLASSSLLEAEVVTADGQVRIANACTHPDLFWGLKGGGGGSLGIVTRLTLRVHEAAGRFRGREPHHPRQVRTRLPHVDRHGARLLCRGADEPALG